MKEKVFEAEKKVFAAIEKVFEIEKKVFAAIEKVFVMKLKVFEAVKKAFEEKNFTKELLKEMLPFSARIRGNSSPIIILTTVNQIFYPITLVIAAFAYICNS